MRRTKFDYRSYHGRKTATDWLKWIALILAILAALAVAALLWGQKYFNYTDEGLKLTLPFFQQESPKPADPGQVDVVIEEEPEPKETPLSRWSLPSLRRPLRRRQYRCPPCWTGAPPPWRSRRWPTAWWWR